jgi:hypothetical protein
LDYPRVTLALLKERPQHSGLEFDGANNSGDPPSFSDEIDDPLSGVVPLDAYLRPPSPNFL